MQLRSLEIFCDVARLRSFSRAADMRGVSQSAVSQTVHHLEDSLGVELVDRSNRPLTLTAAGETYFEGLVEILAEYHQLEKQVIHNGRDVAGPLRVASIYSVGQSYMPDATDEFNRRFPDVEVIVNYGRNESVIEQVLAGDAELGLVSFPKSSKELVAVPWQKEPMRIVCSPRHPLASKNEAQLDDLQGIRMVGFDRSLELRSAIDQGLKRAGLKVKFQSEFDNADSIVRSIEANQGASILPEAAVRRETASGTLRVVACRALKMTRPLGIIYRRASRPSRAGNEFGSLLLGKPLDSPQSKRRKDNAKQSGVGPESVPGTSVVA